MFIICNMNVPVVAICFCLSGILTFGGIIPELQSLSLYHIFFKLYAIVYSPAKWGQRYLNKMIMANFLAQSAWQTGSTRNHTDVCTTYSWCLGRPVADFPLSSQAAGVWWKPLVVGLKLGSLNSLCPARSQKMHFSGLYPFSFPTPSHRIRIYQSDPGILEKPL